MIRGYWGGSMSIWDLSEMLLGGETYSGLLAVGGDTNSGLIVVGVLTNNYLFFPVATL